jgi:hypothetical protein
VRERLAFASRASTHNWDDHNDAQGLLLSVRQTSDRLETYCRSRDWTGFDPYDALNSDLFAKTPLAESRFARLAFTQLLKRSAVNLRPLLRVTPLRDSKATALFLAAYVKRIGLGHKASRSIARELTSRLLELRSPSNHYWCWGYSFPWQTRHRLVPRFDPNLVGTAFAANALLDAYEVGLGDECLEAAASAGEYLVRVLYWEDGDVAAFGYPLPDIRVPIHNANLLGAALLCRLARVTGDRSALPAALRVVRYSVGCQSANGSWAYGTASTQQWIDNFHTGYNLCALHSISLDLRTDEFGAAVKKGFEFYRNSFFTPEGIAKYFHDDPYPIDIHCVAQSVLTLATFAGDANLALARKVLVWAIQHLWDERGYFYYRALRTVTIRTPYMRWSQAWMLLALSTFLERQANDRVHLHA